jgi:dolichyl-diphosphooligosaccharide--protein glycosyltransferase
LHAFHILSDLGGIQVRIYEVKGDDLLGRDLKSANAFGQGKKRKRSKPPLRRKAVL